MTTLLSTSLLRAPGILVSVRYASSKAKGKGKSKQQYKFVPSRVQDAKPDSPAPVVATLQQQHQAQPQDVVVPAFVDASEGVPEREAYFIDEKHLPPARLLYGLGLMLCLMCFNAADIIRREAKPSKDPDAPQVEQWPAWKRYGVATLLTGAGFTMAGVALIWPTRIIKKIDLIAPKGKYLSLTEYQRAGRSTTPYHACAVKISHKAHDIFPRLFKAKVVPFNDLRLLGPLSSSPKWYYPRELAAFEESMKKGGQFAPNVPLAILNHKYTYNLRKREAAIQDLEGFELALMENSGLQIRGGRGVST